MGNLVHAAYMEAAEPVDEAARQAAEIGRDNEWLNSTDWQVEAEARKQDFRDVKFGSKQWFESIDEIPF